MNGHDAQQGRPASGRSVLEEGPATAVHNARGVIAESYHDLQGLAVLEAARRAYPLPKASGASTLRAIFQAVEIGLLNLADVMNRSAADLDAGQPDAAVVKLFWARGFHRLLTRLGMIPQQLGLMSDRAGPSGVLRVSDSPAFADYLAALQRFDTSVLARHAAGALNLEASIADRTLDCVDFNLVHLARICNHESTVWEHSLAEVHVPAHVPSYATFVVASGMRDAVYDRVLTGDSFFTQFRGLHQIPETLGEEVNDRLEQAIRDLRADRVRAAIEQLSRINVLTEGILAALPPIADNLATSDYHQIRENLGLTSGSHSVCLRFHMFTHLYEQLWEELRALVRRTPALGDGTEVDGIREADRLRGADSQTWLIHMLSDQCLRLRAFIGQWREEHLNLPRNNLGGDYTKSLTGSPDAVQAVKHMRDTARGRDPMTPLARSRELVRTESETADGELTRYLDSAESLDSRLLGMTGRITQRRFADVQQRLGFFASRCPFSPPPRRLA